MNDKSMRPGTGSPASGDDYLAHRRQRQVDTGDDLRTDLADYVDLSNQVMAAVTKVLVQHPFHGSGSDAAFVISLLLARLLNDQQVCLGTAETGYVLQAASLAAGTVELANAAAFIGADDKRAEKWLSHTDLKHTYPSSVKESIHAACLLLGLDKAAEEREHENYSRLCMAKHSNPIALSQLGVQLESDRARIHIGPYFDAGVVRAARSAIAAATRASWLAAMVFVHYHAAPAQRDAIARELEPLGAQMLALAERDKGE